MSGQAKNPLFFYYRQALAEVGAGSPTERSSTPEHAVRCYPPVSQDHGGASGNGRPLHSAISRPVPFAQYALGTPPFVSFIEGASEQSRQFVSTRSLTFSLSSLSELPSRKALLRLGLALFLVLGQSGNCSR
jgi:hypothetical protein